MADDADGTVPEVADHEVHEAVRLVAALNTDLATAYRAGDASTVERILVDIATAERRRDRLMRRALAPAPRAGTLPVREQVTRVLGLLQRPATLALIRDVAAARFGDSIAGPRLASLRRDEYRSWTSATIHGAHRAVNRPVYVVPALTYDRMAPMRGVLALSSWPVAARVIAPASPRVDLLHMIDRLVDEAVRAPGAAWAPDVRRLLARLGHTVPGGDGADLAGLRAAVAAELSLVDDDDAAERAASARTMARRLGEEHQLFGTHRPGAGRHDMSRPDATRPVAPAR
jgi:hypothetical protein